MKSLIESNEAPPSLTAPGAVKITVSGAPSDRDLAIDDIPTSMHYTTITESGGFAPGDTDMCIIAV